MDWDVEQCQGEMKVAGAGGLEREGEIKTN